MKILKLDFKNLNSLAGRFHLDFDEGPLAEAGIFAITGPTGAGKTTILDAITLALFGKAARYDEERSPEHMMSRGTGECFSEVLFETGKGRYLARWDLYRARKSPDGKVQPVRRQLATEDGEVLAAKVRDVDEMVVELSGMDYPRFLRSVLLAQGRFREFLDARPADRGELLDRITGTEIYSRLSILAHETARGRQDEIDLAERALEGIRLLDAEELEKFAGESAVCDARKGEIALRLKEVTGRLELHARHGELLKERAAQDARSNVLAEKKRAFVPELARLERHEKAVPVSGDLRDWQGCTRQVKEFEKALKEAGGEHEASCREAAKTLSCAVRACTGERDRLEKKERDGRGKQDRLRGKIREIESWQQKNAGDERLEDTLADIRRRGEECRAAVRAAEDAKKAAGEIRENISRHDSSLKTLRAGLADAGKLLEKSRGVLAAAGSQLDEASGNKPREHWQNEQERARNMLQEISGLKHANEEHSRLQADLQTNETGQKKLRDGLKEHGLRLDRLKKNLDTNNAILRDKEALHTQALTIASLEEHRGRLTDGSPCPLCGALDHPYAVTSLPSTDKTLVDLEKQKKHVRELEAEQSALTRNIAAQEASLDQLKRQGETQGSRLEELVKKFTAIVAGHHLEVKIGDKQTLGLLETDTQETLKNLTLRMEKIDRLEKEKNRAENELVRAEAALKNLETNKEQIEKTISEEKLRLAAREKQATELADAIASTLENFNKTTSPWNSPAENQALTGAVTVSLETRARTWRTYAEQKERHTSDIKQLDYELRSITEKTARLAIERENWQDRLEPFAELVTETPVPPGFTTENSRREAAQAALDRESNTRTRLEATRASLQTASSKLENARLLLDENLKSRGFLDIQELTNSLLADETLTNLRRRQKELADEESQLTALKKQLEQNLEELSSRKPPSGSEADALRGERTNLETENTTILGRMGEIRAILDADKKARLDKIEHITRIKSLKDDAHQWFILRDLIGSADGSKFSRFAQGLTLAQLVALANRHLNDLNPRYSIERIPGQDLELEIIDHYQADATRPTRSLSGGESFLVSLALALGLSELAGRNTRIESLFIDEGFGSLDTNTLDVALAALENLRLKNHTIGVISHGEALKNRLGTRLEVIRQSDGHARLDIVE